MEALQEHSQERRPTLMLVSKVVISTSRKMGPECARGQEVVNVPVISIFIAGRSVAANDALCVEVLKTSAGLGLSRFSALAHFS